MRPKQSLYSKLGIPDGVAVTIILIALVLTLAPYAADKDFGFLKIPAFDPSTLGLLKVLGPVLFVLSILLNCPFWGKTGSPRSAGNDVPATVTFRNASRRFVNVDWLDFDGKRDPEHRYVLPANNDATVATYVGHAWEASDANSGETLKVFVVKRDREVLTVG
jgi:hypothetical protein